MCSAACRWPAAAPRGEGDSSGEYPRREFPCRMGELREKMASGRENDIIRPDKSKTYQSAPTRLGRFGREDLTVRGTEKTGASRARCEKDEFINIQSIT